MRINPDLKTVVPWDEFIATKPEDWQQMIALHDRAMRYLEFYSWCGKIKRQYVGIIRAGIVGVFLFEIEPKRADVDPWIWVIVGNLPSAYITVDECRTAAAALDGYIGAMEEWVDAAESGRSVADLIPVNVPATPEWADRLRRRLQFIDREILSDYRDQLN
jgi:hypothetical protein